MRAERKIMTKVKYLRNLEKCRKELIELCHDVLKFSHGGDLVDLHDTAFYALKHAENKLLY